MSDNLEKIDASAWARADVAGLQVAGPLFGQAHTFVHNERTVTIRLPIVEFGPGAEVVGSRQVASFASGWADNPSPETSTYYVAFVEVQMGVAEKLEIPSEMLAQAPKRPELAGPELTKRLDALVVEYERRMASALSHWQNIARWIAGNSMIGLRESVRVNRASDALELTALIQTSDRHRFWIPTAGISVSMGKAIDQALWDRIGQTLALGYESPIWFRYLDTARKHIHDWRYQDAIIACAIAAETLAREVFWASSGATSVKPAREVLDTVNVRTILGRWTAITGISKNSAHLSEMHKLFDLRNEIMHLGGKGKTLDKTEVSKFLTSANEFILTGDEWVYASRGIPNPRLGQFPLPSKAWNAKLISVFKRANEILVGLFRGR